jgi:hypothetical protein
VREYYLTISEALKNGLKPRAIVPYNSQWLYKCRGFRCGQLGLEPMPVGIDPITNLLEKYYYWPFPQFIQSDTYDFLVIRNKYADTVYVISDNYQSFTPIETISHAYVGKGFRFDIADFGKYVFMTNGIVMIYFNVVSNSWSMVSHPKIPTLSTICNFKGQAIGGGILSDWYDCDETFYAWSNIGSMDFTPDSNNEAGYRRCPWGGKVLHVKELGDMIIGYSTGGLTAIHTATAGEYAPAVIGFKKLYNIGILNKGAVDGDELQHVYVGTDRTLRVITSEGVKELGYKHLIEQLGDEEDVLVVFDKGNRDFYVGNSKTTYLLSPYGMTEIMQHPSTVWRSTNGLHFMPDHVDDEDYELITVPFDMTYRGLKTVTSIETDAMMVTGVEAGLDWTNNFTNWFDAGYRPVNDLGASAITLSANAFRFKLRFKDIQDNFTIGYLTARYKMTDLRNIRGIYAPPPRGQ